MRRKLWWPTNQIRKDCKRDKEKLMSSEKVLIIGL